MKNYIEGNKYGFIKKKIEKIIIILIFIIWMEKDKIYLRVCVKYVIKILNEKLVYSVEKNKN